MIKLKVQNNQKVNVLNAIKKDNIYQYQLEGNIIKIEKCYDSIVIIITNKEYNNKLFFKEYDTYGVLSLGDSSSRYEIELIKLIILDKKIEIEYKIDDSFIFILEEIYDW